MEVDWNSFGTRIGSVSSRLATTWAHGVYSKEAYAPFGETYNEAGTPDRSFTGQDQDTAYGVYDYLFRKYDPSAGRWLSPDPAGWGSISRSSAIAESVCVCGEQSDEFD